ncbi:MAG TPA: protein kinase, partial [Thermoanaerobaculia bacterium]|nr:protein kinase [Thermoanaerobaculia bacterium]
MIGRTLAHYRILERLGSGGMGEVYRAEDTRLQRHVAVKVLPPSLAADPERLERFAREAMAVGALNHPNIVTIHAIEEVAGLRLLVMELVDGPPLDELIPSGGMDRERFFELAIQLADAVSAAHEQGVTHRDLKPSNVMVAGEDRVKVVDFGLAKLRQAARSAERTVALRDDLTEEGRVLGTYPYMSPEQIKGLSADHRSDIFSLGVVLYEMATGERPFAGETSADLISSILRDMPPPPAESNRRLPRHLDRIVAHCLEKDPDRRFQTAKDLRNELQSLRQEIESGRFRPTVGRRRWLPGSPAERPSRRTWAAAAAAAAVLAVGGFLWSARNLPPGRPAAEALRASVTAPSRSVAVLFFQNLSGDPDLEWLRTGLADMLVTDLSQTPNLRVLPTDRVYEILKDLGHLDQPHLAGGVVRAVAERAQVATVLLGSFARAGDTLQVNIQLQDAASGEILTAQRVQGIGEASVFSTVDRLSRELRLAFELPRRDPEIEREIENVTTSSVDAYRAYVEGMRLRRELKLEEAIPLFERAAALDPAFAMAHARLASIHETLGQEQAQREALETAYAHADRLPARERFFIEGSYYGLRREGYERAIEAYERALELYPDHDAARYQLAHVYSFLQLYEPAIQHYEELLRRGYRYDGVYNALATMYAAVGRFQAGDELL